MREKTWLIKSQHNETVEALSRELNVSSIVARLLINRGYDTAETAKRFLHKSVDVLHDPMLMKDMDKAVARIQKAIDEGELITIYGDYDVDGVTATTILYQFIISQGGNAAYYIPDRVEEGYGVNLSAIETIAKSGCSLIVTVDSGITAVEEAAAIKELGVDLIITDHHECGEVIPDAVAVVDPKRSDCAYPFDKLAGVGVVFKLICALAGKDRTAEMIDTYCELVAMGTTADVMPLSDENRLLVSMGLTRLENTKNFGLRALMTSAGVQRRKITTSVIGYSLAPRINAVGRVGKAVRAVDLLLAQSSSQAEIIAEELCEANRQRQDEENKLVKEAYAMIEADPDMLKDNIIILTSNNWHNGVIGIASSRINEKYGLPAVLITIDGDMGKGSSRSSKSPFSIYDALDNVKQYFEKFGGHSSAAGFSIKAENIEPFKKALREYVKNMVTEKELTPKIDIDCELAIDQISMDTINQIAMLEPYGTDNNTPVFMLKDAEILEIQSLSGDRHIRMTVRKGATKINAFCFSVSPTRFGYSVGDKVDIAFNLDTNIYRNVVSPQVTVRDMRFAESERNNIIRSNMLLDKYESGESFTSEELDEVIPNMDDFRDVFRYLRRNSAGITLAALSRRVTAYSDRRMNVCKLAICIDVFSEMGLLSAAHMGHGADANYNIFLIPVAEKKDLNKSTILNRLREQRGKYNNERAF